jgi:uncharacterized protein
LPARAGKFKAELKPITHEEETMASTLRTPGVYVQEISLFPPSVAEVETAIPAFIGYTGKAKDKKAGDLHRKPLRLRSLADFREKFGGPPPVHVENVNLTGDNSVQDFDLDDQYLMYDSLRLYFANGGGDCYIVSIGDFHQKPAQADFIAGISALEKYDEPTLFVFPDAVLLSAEDLGNVQKAALAQSADLMDRFVICDVKDREGISKDVAEFRKQIGSRNLKYGAAYYPDLHANLGRNLKYRDIKGKVKKYSQPFDWSKLIGDDDDLEEALTRLDNIVDSNHDLDSELSTFKQANSLNTLEEYFENEKAAFFNSISEDANINTIRSNFVKMVDAVYELAHKFLDERAHDKWGKDSNPLFDYLSDLLTTQLAGVMKGLVEIDNSAVQLLQTGGQTVFPRHDQQTWNFTGWAGAFNPTDTNNAAFPETGTDTAHRRTNMIAVEPIVSSTFYSVVNAIREVLAEGEQLESQHEQVVVLGLPALKNVLETLNRDTSILPPSGAVAGIYADVDRKRGVWKAPANVSLNSVVKLSQDIDSKDQASMNIDTTAGKSVNAIRVFSGRGHMVWGARTLAGNDNEWRYVPVRRFFNMVEESVKNSTYWAVFEPNDANTWVKVKAMIENYLTQKWREGALAGATTDEAFFVKVGLGLTMTNVDILEGRMNVEIGMAAVRPAEFIILKFSHKMQES